MLDAIIFASGSTSWVKERIGSECKALLPIFSRAMIEYVIATLQKSNLIENIYIVSNHQELARYNQSGVQFMSGGKSFFDNFSLMRTNFPLTKKILLVSDDIPLLTVAALDDFLEQCNSSDADVLYPVVPKQVLYADNNQTKRMLVKLVEGSFTGGNIIWIDQEAVLDARTQIEAMFTNRKSPLKLCQMVGWGVLLKFLCRTLSLRDIEQSANRLFGFRCQAVISEFAEMGIDVDKPTDLEFVEQKLEKLL